MVSSTTPRLGPRCPPFLERIVMSSQRISSASCCNWSSLSFLTCSGLSTMSRYRFISGERAVEVIGIGSAEKQLACFPAPKISVPRGCDGRFSNSGRLFRSGIIFPSLKIDRKSTRLNSSHSQISYAVFCLKKNKRGHKNDKRDSETESY